MEIECILYAKPCLQVVLDTFQQQNIPAYTSRIMINSTTMYM